MKVEYEKHVFVAYCRFYPYSPQPAMFWSNVISLLLANTVSPERACLII
jgi:hypothetical protein